MSAHTHGGLTYNSVSDAIHAHDRKGIGREGKGREGNRRSPSIHNVTQVTRKAAPEQTVTPADEWMESFDFEAEVPCRVHWYEHPAQLVVRKVCPRCHFSTVAPVCRSWWEKLGRGRLRCKDCDFWGTREESFRIVEVLR